MLAEKVRDLGLDRLGQQSTRPIAQDFGELIVDVSWLNQLDDAIFGHGISLLRWRSGGVKHPHDMPPFRFPPSPTFSDSSHPMGGKFFRNHINFHHTYYSKDHLVSRTYRGDEGNNTPFFFIPVFLVGACTYLVLPIDLFVVQVVACAASFYAHVFFDKEYHVEGSRLQRFAWFRRKQELHFVHHRHANCNFAVIHFFRDRILGTYRRTDAGQP